MLLVKPTITECLSRTGRDGRRVRLPLRWVYQNALPAHKVFSFPIPREITGSIRHTMKRNFSLRVLVLLPLNDERKAQ